nr:ABC transporter substrate-binding protein [Maliibacterium massiliense]
MLFACSPSTTQPSGATSASASSPSADKPADGKKTFYFITKVLGNAYWAVVEDGVRAAAEEKGVEVVYTGLQQETDVEKQVQLVADAIQAEPDAILIAPCDSFAMVNSVKEAYDTGIPVILIDTAVDGDAYTACVKTDNVKAGAICAEEMIRHLKERNVDHATVGILATSSGSQTVIDRIDGFTEYFEANAPDDWKILTNEIKYSEGDLNKCVNNTQDILMAHPDCNALWAINGSSTDAAGTVIKELGRDDVVVVGVDFFTNTEDLIRDGYIQSAVVQQQYMMGYEGVMRALDVLEGKQVEKVIDTGVVPISLENIDTPEAEKVMYPAGRPKK